MHTKVDDVHTLDELRHFIHKTLCEKENLLVDQFTMTEFQLTRGNEPCGIQFSLRGPRNVRLAAIWVADRDLLYLYDARGTRYAKLRLTNRCDEPIVSLAGSFGVAKDNTVYGGASDPVMPSGGSLLAWCLGPS